jgi:hypothetical protein
MTEVHNVKVQRLSYLRAVLKYRDVDRSLLYVDTTSSWIIQTPFCWSDNRFHGPLVPASTERKTIFINSGGVKGCKTNSHIA